MNFSVAIMYRVYHFPVNLKQGRAAEFSVPESGGDHVPHSSFSEKLAGKSLIATIRSVTVA
jgi:hypothetical protein